MAVLKPTVLITDGDQRAALACTRALHCAGFECFVLGPSEGNLAGSSRHCTASGIAPDPLIDPDGFLEAVRNGVETWRIDTLLPITEKSLRVVLPNKGVFPNVSIPFPSAEVFSRVSDKAEVLGEAKKLGIRVAKQWEISAGEGDSALSIPDGQFPLVVKPTRSVAIGSKYPREAGVSYVSDSRQLRSHLLGLPDSVFPVLIQQRILGKGAGVFLLIWEGELRAIVGHRRVREKPPSGGVSVVRQSTSVDPMILDQSLRLLSGLGWENGVAMVEYKVQDGTGIPYLMEINGRFWGSLQLAIDAGVDFPTLLVQCASGDPPSELVLGRPGITTRWLLGDLDQLLLRLFRRRVALNLPTSEPGRLKSIVDFVRDFRPGVRNEVLRFSDPGPFVSEFSDWLKSLLRRR